MTRVRAHRSKAELLSLCLLFFVSGAVGLAYEVAWTRGLLLLLGSTAGASALVLGVFVAGLGLGARWGGRKAETSERPLALYGVLEILAAGWACIGLVLLTWLAGPYVSIATMLPEVLRPALRLLLAAFIVFPSSFLLGATLPAMVRHFVEGASGSGRTVAWLYGINTVGAVAGCLWTGFWGIEVLGVTGVLLVAAAVAVAVGLISMHLAKSAAAHTPTPPAPVEPAARSAALAALVCGFIGLGIEVAGFRILVFFLEGFTITFAAMLGVFIAGLGLGSLALGPVLTRTSRPARVLGGLLLAQAVLLVISLYVIVPSFEEWMRSIKAGAYQGAAVEAEITGALRMASLVGSAILLFLPAFLMGPTFALCVRWAECAGLPPGDAVGRAYVGNAVGSIAAPLLLTFAVIPSAGVLGAWLLVGAFSLVFGLALIVLPRTRLERPPLVGAAALVALLLALGAPLLQLAGTRTVDLVEASVVLAGRSDRSLVDYATDSVTTASVVETRDGERILYTDDFPAAATGRYYRYMRMLGHLPAVLAKDPANAMVIAFGTGTTAGAVAAHDTVKRIEVVEVSSAVLSLAHHFEEANRGVLEDKRVQVVRDDGRNALLLHEPDLDLITLEPLMPYSPAGLPFYTREFYELAKARLRDGGVVCQWVPVHAMRADLYASFVRTFFDVFPEGSLWFFEQSSALIGWKGAGRPSRAELHRRLQAIAGDMQDAGFDDLDAFASGYLASGREVLDGPDPIAVDDSYLGRLVLDGDPFPEFHPTPRARLNTQYLEHTLQWLEELVDPLAEPDDQPWWPVAMKGRRNATKQALRARRYGARADFLGVYATSRSISTQVRASIVPEMLEHHDMAAVEFSHALRMMPGDRVWRSRRLRNLRAGAIVRSIAYMRRGDGLPPAEAKELWIKAAALMRSVMPPLEPDPDPIATDHDRAARTLAMIQLRLGRCGNAEWTLQRAVDLLEHVSAGQALVPAAAAVRELIAGGSPTEPAWLLGGPRRVACRPGGLGAIASEWSAFLSAVHSKSDGRMRAAALRLDQGARREGLERVLADSLPGFDVRGATPAAEAAAAALLVSLLPGQAADEDALNVMCAADAAERRRAALQEISRRRLGDRYVAAVRRGMDDEEATVRRAAVRAAATAHDRDVLCRTVEALMDPDVDVRTEAVGAVFDRASPEIEGYDATAGEAARKRVVDVIRVKLGCVR